MRITSFSFLVYNQSAMKKVLVLIVLAALNICASAQAPRPKIVGIDHVSFYTTAPDGVKKLYGEILGLAAAAPIEPNGTLRYIVGAQWVGYSPAPDPNATERMDHVAFTTDNIIALRKYLVEKGIKPSQIEGRADHSMSLSVNDPKGHRIEFYRASTRRAGAGSECGLPSHDPYRHRGAPSGG